MNKSNALTEESLLSLLKQDNEGAFVQLFCAYHKSMVLFAGNFLDDQQIAEDIVQNIFLKLWTDRKDLQISGSLKSYLLVAVRNSCLDELRHLKIRQNHRDFCLSHDVLSEYDTENYILYSDLQQQLDKALNQLPNKYREAFEMSRNKGLKYREIANKLQVSERTVEVRLGKALALLRNFLSEYLPILLFIACSSILEALINNFICNFT
ncbi:DNA-directed RNA polymerase sigma-70 factor [Bacteroidales bacterium]|nr:DNA-directed RNA polymerase sigma-70 factor [Bacteroidales bacterium]